MLQLQSYCHVVTKLLLDFIKQTGPGIYEEIRTVLYFSISLSFIISVGFN